MEEFAIRLTEPFIQISDDISFNPTLFIQLVFFLFLLIVLKPLLWKPFLARVDERHALTVGDAEKAQAEEAEALELEAAYRERIREARKLAAAKRNELRVEAQKAEKEILDGARGEAAKLSASLRDEVESAAEKARGALRNEARDIAALMSEKMTGQGAS